ncbi:MAG: phage tail protein [Spirochaetota bacterium]
MKTALTTIKNWTLAGIGLGLGLFISYAFAVSVGTLNTFTSGSTVSSSEINSNFITLKTAIESLNTEVQTNLTSITDLNTQIANRLVPVGTTLPYAGSSAPTGFLLCDGSAVSRTTYADLFAILGTTWGSGDGSTTFNLPDARAAVPAGAGTSVKFVQNVTRTIGAYVNDQFQSFAIEANAFAGNASHDHGSGPPLPTQPAPAAGSNASTSSIFMGLRFLDNTVDGFPRVGNETRGKQFVVNYIIKY